MFPDFLIFQGTSEWGGHVEGQNVVLDPGRLKERSEGDEKVMIGCIAHEIAHIIVDDSTLTQDMVEKEYEVDEMAASWGLEEEVDIFRQKFGPPTYEDEDEGES